ncbi:MAG: hypothetical protein ABSG33_12335 [Candidatus Bathyarchaeia archaeon]
MTAFENAVFRILRLLRRLPFNPLSLSNQKIIFAQYFRNFENVEAVKGIFGEKTSEVLGHLTVEISWIMGYMYVDGGDGHLVISKNYLNNGNKTDIYLDLIHELCHVKQFMNGKELFDPRYEYVDRPTEIEAYRYTVKEARRLGLSEERICRYLRTEWMNDEDFLRLAKAVNVQVASAS